MSVRRIQSWYAIGFILQFKSSCGQNHHCQLQTFIGDTANTSQSEVAQRLGEINQTLQSQWAIEQYNRALADLDQRWQQELQAYLTYHPNGSPRLPDERMSFIGGVAIIVMGLLFTAANAVFAIFSPLAFCTLPFGLLMAVLGLVGILIQRQKAKAYQSARDRYLANRQQLHQSQMAAGQKA